MSNENNRRSLNPALKGGVCAPFTIKQLTEAQFHSLFDDFHVDFEHPIQTDFHGTVWYDEYDKPCNRRYIISAEINTDYKHVRIRAKSMPSKFGDSDENCSIWESCHGIFPRDWSAKLEDYVKSDCAEPPGRAVTRCLERLDDMQAAVDNMRDEAPESCHDLDALIEGTRYDIVQHVK